MESNQSAQDLFTGYFKEIDTKKIAVVGASLAVACASAYYLFSPKSQPTQPVVINDLPPPKKKPTKKVDFTSSCTQNDIKNAQNGTKTIYFD